MSTVINGVTLDAATMRRLRNMPVDELLETANELLYGYGVEYIRHKDDTWRDRYGLEYVNTGGSYDTTIIWDHKRERMIIGSWGDIVERAPEGRYL